MRRVLALSPIPEEGAGCRFRIAQFIPYLRQAGYDVTVRPFFSPSFFRLVYRPGNYFRKTAAFFALTLARLGVSGMPATTTFCFCTARHSRSDRRCSSGGSPAPAVLRSFTTSTTPCFCRT